MGYERRRGFVHFAQLNWKRVCRVTKILTLDQRIAGIYCSGFAYAPCMVHFRAQQAKILQLHQQEDSQGDMW
jgi:hypothetical protein